MGAIQSFGSILPTLMSAVSTVQTIAGTLNDVQNLSDGTTEQDKLALKQLQAKQNLQQQQLTAQNTLEKERIVLANQTAEEDRISALRRAVARQRASFGSSGVGSVGGSSEAVLLGLFEESDTEREQRESLDNLRVRAIDQDAAQNNSLNLLQATQLVEKQNLKSLF